MYLHYNPALGEAAPILIPGDPPVDQTALVAALQAQIVQLTQERDAREAAITAMKAAVLAAAGAF